MEAKTKIDEQDKHERKTLWNRIKKNVKGEEKNVNIISRKTKMREKGRKP